VRVYFKSSVFRDVSDVVTAFEPALAYPQFSSLRFMRQRRIFLSNTNVGLSAILPSSCCMRQRCHRFCKSQRQCIRSCHHRVSNRQSRRIFRSSFRKLPSSVQVVALSQFVTHGRAHILYMVGLPHGDLLGRVDGVTMRMADVFDDLKSSHLHTYSTYIPVPMEDLDC
jgi:hypothetical protein